MSPLPAGYRIVSVPESREDEFRAVDHFAFGSEPTPETVAAVPTTLEWDRTMGVERPDGSLAAVHSSYDFDLPVPGGAVPCAGLTCVGVRPDERRRGLLSAMIATHFERALGRGEPVSALFAAESAIYGRFGFGLAADDVRLKVPRSAALRDVPGSDELTVTFDTVDRERHTDLVQDVHRRAGAGRPGWMPRKTDALRARPLVDPPAWRDGGEPLRIVVVRDAAGDPRAYALLRRKEVWSEPGPRYPVTIRESAAVDAAAAHRLWSFVLDMDLTSEIATGMLPADDPLLHLLVDLRGALPHLVDNLWVRLLDVPAALAGRRYQAPLDTVLAVTDARLPANAWSWRLVAGELGADGTYAATVEPTDAPADLSLDVRELGSAYLGGRSLTSLAAAGLVVEHRPGAALAAGAAFGWPLAPVCSWVF
ncbi:MAG: GNAT family N-acetyltransferase [Brevundimonas sp.]